MAARCAHPFTVSRARPVAGGFELGFISRHGAGAAPGDTIEVFVFDRPHATGLYDMQTFDAQGRIVYDSTRKYMRVVDFLPLVFRPTRRCGFPAVGSTPT